MKQARSRALDLAEVLREGERGCDQPNVISCRAAAFFELAVLLSSQLASTIDIRNFAWMQPKTDPQRKSDRRSLIRQNPLQEQHVRHR